MHFNNTLDINVVDDIISLTDIIFSKSRNISYLRSFFNGLPVDENFSSLQSASLRPSHFDELFHMPDAIAATTLINKTDKICSDLDAESADHESDR